MRVLVAWGSKLGGTEEIGRTIAEELRRAGHEVTARPARELHGIAGYDAAVIGGGVYANLWHADAYRFAIGNLAALRRIPVWLFSSGPLDDSADNGDMPVPRQVAVLARVRTPSRLPTRPTNRSRVGRTPSEYRARSGTPAARWRAAGSSAGAWLRIRGSARTRKFPACAERETPRRISPGGLVGSSGSDPSARSGGRGRSPARCRPCRRGGRSSA